MPINIYNSLTKEKEELKPIDGKKINMYCCGVTVYDKCHIGHARSLYLFEVITNYLRFSGYDVHFIRNITDIDDKIIKKANDLGKTSEEVALENIEKYKSDLKSLELHEADQEPRATENIKEMIVHIQKLIEKGFAYESDGDVYFKVRAFKDYGKLSGQSIDKMLEGVRIEKGVKKQDSLDFALWKKSKEGEPKYDSPWGDGRPGWHIECSVMSMKYLNCETLDIHAGGRDLIFPHHENEIAQSEALTGKLFAKYWIHHGLLTINGQKMAKSLGNFITVEDAVKKYQVNDIKMFFLSSHYTSAIDFSEDKVGEAHKNIDKIKILFSKQSPNENSIEDKDVLAFKQEFIQAMDNDFNTPKALGSLFDLIAFANKNIGSDKGQDAVNLLKQFCEKILGLNLKIEEGSLTQEESFLLKERIDVRINKDFTRSDEIRDLLKEKGIVVEDGKDGQTHRRM